MKKPWNRTDLPVFSVSSFHGEYENMHICTYVSAVSMQPKRFMVALYKGTRTLELASKEKRFILQLMAEDQTGLILPLGRRSGHQTDKIAYLQRRNLLTEWQGRKVLKDALAWIELAIIKSMDAGDHVMMLCDVKTYRNARQGNPLSLDILRAKGLIRN